MVQCNISFNQRKGTLRGMHFQVAPHEELKLVRCTMGAIYDVIIDLRQVRAKNPRSSFKNSGTTINAPLSSVSINFMDKPLLLE